MPHKSRTPARLAGGIQRGRTLDLAHNLFGGLGAGVGHAEREAKRARLGQLFGLDQWWALTHKSGFVEWGCPGGRRGWRQGVGHSSGGLGTRRAAATERAKAKLILETVHIRTMQILCENKLSLAYTDLRRKMPKTPRGSSGSCSSWVSVMVRRRGIAFAGVTAGRSSIWMMSMAEQTHNANYTSDIQKAT